MRADNIALVRGVRARPYQCKEGRLIRFLLVKHRGRSPKENFPDHRIREGEWKIAPESAKTTNILKGGNKRRNNKKRTIRGIKKRTGGRSEIHWSL